MVPILVLSAVTASLAYTPEAAFSGITGTFSNATLNLATAVGTAFSAAPSNYTTLSLSEVFDLRPTAIIRDLDLQKPIYRQLAAYGHMGREDLGVKWENTDRVDALKAAVAAL